VLRHKFSFFRNEKEIFLKNGCGEVARSCYIYLVRQKRLIKQIGNVLEISRMKYALRRLVFSVVITPAVALAYTIGYGALVAVGTGGFSPIGEVWSNGLIVGVVFSLAFSVSAVFPRWVEAGEN
jgi:hypothetical protein